jgi:hypothetical protein
MTATAISADKLAKMTPTTMSAIKIHGQPDPGRALFDGGSVIVSPLSSIGQTDSE